MKNIYQLKIQVKNVKPSIYRTILVDENITFYKLHQYIQAVFGLMDYHLWQFSGKLQNPFAAGPEFKIEPTHDDQWEEPEYYAEQTKLNEILKKEKQKLSYWYDFGDDWEFFVTLQKIIPQKELNPKIEKIPFLLKAKGPMLLEDVGGIHFWEDILNMYERIEKGEKISDEEINEDFGVIQKIIGDSIDEGEEIGMYEAIISELYETDWKTFDIEENIFSLKDDIG